MVSDDMPMKRRTKPNAQTAPGSSLTRAAETEMDVLSDINTGSSPSPDILSTLASSACQRTRLKQRIDNRAVGNAFAAATRGGIGHHALQSLKICDLATNISNMIEDQRSNLGARIGMAVHKMKQAAQLVKREAEFTTATDKSQALEMVRGIKSIAAVGTRGLRHDANLLVKADGLDVDVTFPGKGSDRKILPARGFGHGLALESVATTDIRIATTLKKSTMANHTTPLPTAVRSPGSLTTLLALSWLGAAFGLASCCALPFLLAGFGLGTAWLAGIELFALFHRTAILVVALISLGCSAALLSRQRRTLKSAAWIIIGTVCLIGAVLFYYGYTYV